MTTSRNEQTTRIRETTFATHKDRRVEVTRVIQSPRNGVFDAWTSPQHVPNWMTGPSEWDMPVCEIDLRPGGSYRYVWRRPDDTEIAISGVYREIDRPSTLVTNESWGGSWPETRDTLQLTEDGGATILTLVIEYPSNEARDAALKTGMMDGLATSLDNLASYLTVAE